MLGGAPLFGQVLPDRQVLPSAIPPERYQAIWRRAPFSPPSQPPDEGPSSEWALSGYLRSGDHSLVFLVDRQTQKHLVVTETPNSDGLALCSIDGGPDLLHTSVRVKVAEEIVTVKFDPDAVLVAASADPASAASPPPPTVFAQVSLVSPPFVPSGDAPSR
ncbi:hypothetical protein [Verrucomicrobium sp. GAS474]|uniref:hypothetical protein n=1 Tax=Verrucomicrobium sp. GAS474 TaxID=1882831 RepID=UPI000B8672FC|nr:hypothetical protein [Verrucomicrobium sp. GAS474]